MKRKQILTLADFAAELTALLEGQKEKVRKELYSFSVGHEIDNFGRGVLSGFSQCINMIKDIK